MSPNQFSKWVSDYLLAYAEGVEHDPSNEAIQEFIDVTYDEPEISWKAILEIMSRVPNERVIGALSAGPLEDIIYYHGDAFIERIEEQAKNDPRFRHLLGGVWRGGSIEIWNRVIKARNYKSW